MDKKSLPLRAFTMVEMLVVLSIMAILAAVVVPHLTEGLGLSNMSVIRQQAKSTQTALDSWLIESRSISAARQQFAPSAATVGGKATSVPSDLSAFLQLIALHLNPESKTQFTLITAPDGNSAITTTAMARAAAYVTITWDTDYMNTPPRANLVIP